MVGRSPEGDEGAVQPTEEAGLGADELVDPVTGVPLGDLMVSAAHIGVNVEDPEGGGDPDFDPAEVPDADPADRGGPPVIAGFHKIDFEDDDAIDEMVAGVVEEYKAAAKAAGLKMAPRGSLVVISEGGVPVENPE